MSNTDSLIGKRVAIRANDFLDVASHGRIQLVEPQSNSLLIGLDTPVNEDGLRYTRVVASPRLERDSVGALQLTGKLGCGITWIPETRFSESAPFDLSWWRGGAAAVADVVLERQGK